MFDEILIIEFINRIINNAAKNSLETKENLIQFRDYLVVTKMTDDETIEKVDKVIMCFESIMNIKNVLGHVDIATMFQEKEEIKGRGLKKVPIHQTKYIEKHYHHYEPTVSSSCGSSSSTSRC
jgi:hypothetical protein